MLRRGAKAKEMRPRPRQRFRTFVGIPLVLSALAACDDGLVKLELLSAAGGDPDAGSRAAAGAGGSTTRAGFGGSVEPRGGIGGSPRPPSPNPCGEGSEQEQADERELREAFIDAFDSGRYCPNLSNMQRRTLTLDRDLEWRARGFICIPTDTRNWFEIPRTPVWAWVLWDTPNLEDAKRALLGGDHTELCEEAERMSFRHIGVGHLYDVWTVFLSPGTPEDMQKP